MPRRLTRRLLTMVVVAMALLLNACANDNTPKAADGLAKRTEQIGGLTVTVTPVQLDRNGASFAIAFDTHTGAPTIDVAHSSSLTVGGAQWTNSSWTGDGPGGHHRSGTLRFDAAGEPSGTLRLSISGLERPLEFTWDLAA